MRGEGAKLCRMILEHHAVGRQVLTHFILTVLPTELLWVSSTWGHLVGSEFFEQRSGPSRTSPCVLRDFSKFLPHHGAHIHAPAEMRPWGSRRSRERVMNCGFPSVLLAQCPLAHKASLPLALICHLSWPQYPQLRNGNDHKGPIPFFGGLNEMIFM